LLVASLPFFSCCCGFAVLEARQVPGITTYLLPLQTSISQRLLAGPSIFLFFPLGWRFEESCHPLSSPNPLWFFCRFPWDGIKCAVSGVFLQGSSLWAPQLIFRFLLLWNLVWFPFGQGPFRRDSFCCDFIPDLRPPRLRFWHLTFFFLFPVNHLFSDNASPWAPLFTPSPD